MKIRKFNEDIDEKLDLNYINECFISLMDNSKLNPLIINSGDIDIVFGFDLPIGTIGEEYKEEELIDIGDNIKNIFTEVYSSIEKVRLEYRDININISLCDYKTGGVNKNYIQVIISLDHIDLYYYQ